jgi:phytoene/squalene synthetase
VVAKDEPPPGLTPEQQMTWWREVLAFQQEEERKSAELVSREIDHIAERLERLNAPEWDPTRDL